MEKKFKINDYVRVIDNKDLFGKVVSIDVEKDRVVISDGNHLYDVAKNNLKLESFAHIDDLKIESENTNNNNKYEMVNHPTHYHPGDYEAIKVIKAWLGDEGCYNFCIANSIKYISRLGFKPDSGISKEGKLIEDIDKAIWYLEYAKECKNNL